MQFCMSITPVSVLSCYSHYSQTKGSDTLRANDRRTVVVFIWASGVLPDSSLEWIPSVSPTAGFRMNSVSPRTDMTSVSGLHGNQTLANMSSPSDTAIEAYVVPWGWVALYAITTLIVILGNGLVIVAVFRYQFLQTLTNTFVVGVAAIDLSSSSTGWMKIADLIWPNSMAGYGPCLIRQTVGSINGVGSASLLLCKLFVE